MAAIKRRRFLRAELRLGSYQPFHLFDTEKDAADLEGTDKGVLARQQRRKAGCSSRNRICLAS